LTQSQYHVWFSYLLVGFMIKFFFDKGFMIKLLVSYFC